MNIVEATKSYEHWLGGHMRLVKSDVKAKHKIMHDSAFGFFRATYYRWLQQQPKHCLEAEGAPKLLGVGDLHLENFGTWRDGEARLVWASTISTKRTQCPTPTTSCVWRRAR